MRHLDASPRVLLKLPFAIRLGIAALSVALVLVLFIVLPAPARSPSMLAIPMAIVAWMFRKRGAFISLMSIVVVLWLFYAYELHGMLLSRAMITSFIAGTVALVIVGILVSLLRDSVDWTERARLETAQALELSVPAVKSRLLRARLQLRDKLTAFFKKKVEDPFAYL